MKPAFKSESTPAVVAPPLWLLGLITLVGAFVRLFGLGDRCLWCDEAYAWRIAVFPVLELIGRISNPLEGDNPPLYFVMLHYVLQAFGQSEFVLRLLAALPGAAAVPMAYLFARELCRFAPPSSSLAHDSTSRWVGMLAAGLTATSEIQLHASRQVRMYSLGALLYLAASWALLRSLRHSEKGNGWAWALYAALAAALCYTHNTALFSVVAHVVFAAIYLVWKMNVAGRGPERAWIVAQWRRLLLVCAILALVYLPEAVVLRERSYEAHESNAWMGGLDRQKSGYQAVAALTSEEFAGDLMSTRYGLRAALLVAGVIYLCALRAGWAGVFACLGMAVPTACMYAYALDSGISLFVIRYLIFVQLTWIAALALLFASPPTGWLGVGVRCMGLLVWCYWCVPYWEAVLTRDAAPGMRAVHDHIAANRRRDELLLTSDVVTHIKLSYYFCNECSPRMITAIPSPRLQRQSAYINEPELIAPDELAVHPAQRVWIVTSGPSEIGDLPRLFPGRWTLAYIAEFRQDYSWEGPVVVRCYERLAARRTPGTSG